MRADLKAALAASIGAMADGCNVVPDEDDGQTLLVEYPSLYPGGGDVYVSPRVKIEAGARSALDPSTTRAVTPYVAGELPDWSFRVANVATLAPERTFWEKLLILHGLHCGYRDAGRLPADKDRILAALLRRRDDRGVPRSARPPCPIPPCSTRSGRTISSPSGRHGSGSRRPFPDPCGWSPRRSFTRPSSGTTGPCTT